MRPDRFRPCGRGLAGLANPHFCPSGRPRGASKRCPEMKQLDASTVARLLVEYGQRLALRGGNPYRARAYATAADNLMALTVPLAVVVSQNRLPEIPGGGPAVAARI